MKLEDQNYNKKILNEKEGNDLIGQYFINNKSFLVGRSGGTECKIISHILRFKENVPEHLQRDALVLSGIYPNDQESLCVFANHYVKSINNIDVMAVWAARDYDWLANTFCPDGHYVRLWGLEPYHFSNPWSKHLENKNVLVIHPFEKSIINNYKNRKKIFLDQSVLPDFNLITIKAEQNLGNENSNYFETIKRTQDKIAKKNFDVAIVGCGAAGLPLSSFIKDMGKIAIHMGGATQILFGILGKRWKDYPQFNRIINEHWTKPLPEEVPANYFLVESGCYW